MSIALRLKLGPRDHGQPISNADLAASEFVRGFKYEVIDGRLYVSYEPDLSEDRVERWLSGKLDAYSTRRPDVLNYVTRKARVFVTVHSDETIPEPDLTAYQDFPVGVPLDELRWQDISPVLVAEIFSGSDPDKDLVRNVKLYLRVPSIREYWIVDTSENPNRPTLLVYRRRGSRWMRVIEVAFGETYITKLLPGFELIVDPRR